MWALATSLVNAGSDGLISVLSLDLESLDVERLPAMSLDVKRFDVKMW